MQCLTLQGVKRAKEISMCETKKIRNNNNIPANFSDAKAWDFHQNIVESLCSYPKIPKNLLKIYKDYQNVSKDPPIILGTRSQDIICQTQPVLFLKLENLPWKNCHLCILFQSIIALSTNYTIFSRCLPDNGCDNSYFPVRREMVRWRN